MTWRPNPNAWRFNLRVEVTAEPLLPALERFFAEVRELAGAHPGIEACWISEAAPVGPAALRVPPFRDDEAPPA